MEILAERLYHLRKELHLRQSDVSKELHIALITYQRYEANQRDPDAPVIATMARFFNVSADYLLGLTDQR